MFGLFGSSERPRLLAGTVKIVAAVAFLSVLATKYLSEGLLDQNSLSRLVASATRGADEPTTTGSITKAAGAVRLDPCAKR